jgi:Spy/CpxP family protein refolding chaperone
MKTTRSLLTIVAVAVAVVAPATLAAGLRQDRQDKGDALGAMHKVLNKLDLTDKQKGEIKGIVEVNREGFRQAVQARIGAFEAYGAAIKTGQEAGIREAGASVGSAMADVGVIRAKTWAAIKAVLTPEQLQQLATMEDGAKERLDRQPKEGPNTLKRALARLDLTDQQKQQIAGILEANRQAVEQAKEARAAAMKAYVQAVNGGDEASIRSAGAAVGKAMADMAVLRLQVAGTVKAVLTPEQRQQLEAMKDHRAQRSTTALSPVDRPAKNNRRAGLLALLSNEKVFNRIDRNGDGVISMQEVRALMRQEGMAQAAVGQTQ